MEAVAIEPQKPPESLHFAGELIDAKYHLERELGAGAMGRVWLARNVMLDLPVAIKIVDVQLHGRDALARVLAEARLLAQLSHPNIVRVLDCHSDEGAAYVVMELLEGCTLAELMEEGPLPAALVVRLVVPLLDALAAAHRDGIVHRDIKPENIFVARRGDRICPKLLDFGIARSGAAQPASKEKRLIVGTPGYMSPEQALGEAAVDHRADIWAMGVVMYEAISGGSAFQSSSYSHYLRALRERKLAPLTGESASGLWMVLERAMSHASEARFASANEFAATLRLWLRARGLREDLKGDSLPEHWAVRGSVVDRAFCRSERRVSGEQAAASGRRRIMPGSLTLVDPRVPVHEGSHARTRTHALAASAPPKRPLILWASAASMLCATLALLHARADAGNTSASRPRKLGSLVAEAAPQLQLSAADHSSLRAPSERAPNAPPRQHASTPASASVEPEHKAPQKSGVRRATTGRSRAAHSGDASRAPANIGHAEANRRGLKSPW